MESRAHLGQRADAKEKSKPRGNITERTEETKEEAETRLKERSERSELGWKQRGGGDGAAAASSEHKDEKQTFLL